MKIISRANAMVLSKKELTSKDKSKKFYQVILFIPETEENHKLFIPKEKFDNFKINNLYAVELIFIINDGNISCFLQN